MFLPSELARDPERLVYLQEASSVGAFEWQSPMRAPNYRVSVYWGQQAVWTMESGETRVARPNAVAIDPGVEYTWKADALDAEGTVRMATGPQRDPFIKIHSTLRVTPAMAAGVTERLYVVSDLMALLIEAESKKAS